MGDECKEYLIATRRKLHGLAELSGEEKRTSDFIVQELGRLGYSPKTVRTGVYCDAGPQSGKRLAFRADIDALPIRENTAVTGCDFAADGDVMHACGHDGHTANLLNIARILGGKSEVPLRFIFQFGEEGAGGAFDMIDGGALNGVDEIYALHLCPELEEGKIGYCYGGMFAGCVEFDVEIKGKAAHCSSPEYGADAIKASVYVAERMFETAKKHGLLLNLGKITGGAARNVVSDFAKSEFTLRFYDRAKSEEAMIEFERSLIESDGIFGTKHDILTQTVYSPLINDALCVDKVRAAAGARAVEVKPRNTAEDFSEYLKHIPGCMVWLGIRTEKHTSPLHSDTFSFDEGALIYGTELFLNLIEARKARRGA